MIFKFLLLSNEVEDFKREIKIDSDDTFLDLHKAIIECSGFGEVDMTSFIICDEKWRRKQEITLVEIETDSDVDSFVMEEEVLSDWLVEEKEKLMFMFDRPKDRSFYIELSEIILGKGLSKPICSKKEGEAPPQFIQKEVGSAEPTATSGLSIETEEKFYGDEDYDPEELDIEGFDGLNNDVDIDDTELL